MREGGPAVCVSGDVAVLGGNRRHVETRSLASSRHPSTDLCDGRLNGEDSEDVAQPQFLTAFVGHKGKASWRSSPFVCSLRRARTHLSDVEPAKAEGYLRRLETKHGEKFRGFAAGACLCEDG